jgi:hypothetical protein
MTAITPQVDDRHRLGSADDPCLKTPTPRAFDRLDARLIGAAEA